MSTKTLHLALLDTTADWEIGYLTAHLRNGQFQVDPGAFDVTTVGVTDQPVTTMGGLRVLPDTTLEQLDPAQSAMLVLPGGDRWETPDGQSFVAAAARFLEHGTPVAAICGATFALASAGLLDEREHTSNDPGYLASSGYAGSALYRTDPVVVDQGVVTATAVAPVHFARAIFELLGSHSPTVLDSWTKLYGDRDPAGYYELMSV